MCLIAVKRKGVELPLEEHLKEGSDCNTDGTGVCYWKNGDDKVHIKKDFVNFAHLSFWLKGHITKEDALIVHFRKSTSGLVDNGNRHPFPITMDPELIRKDVLTTDLAMAHNGVLFKFNSSLEKGRNDDHNDTQNFIMEIIAQDVVKNNLNSPVMERLLCEFIGTNKLAFMDKNGDIKLLGNFVTEKVEGGEIYFSNTGYRKYTPDILPYNSYRSHHGSRMDYNDDYSPHSSGPWYNNVRRGIGFNEIKKEVGLVKSYPSIGEIKRIEHKEIKTGNETVEEVQGNITILTSRMGKQILGICQSGCGYYGSLGIITCEEDKRNYYLCKKCRKRVRKNRLILKLGECSNCNTSHFTSELIHKYNEFPLCKECFEDFKYV